MQNSPFQAQPAYFTQGRGSPFVEDVKHRISSPVNVLRNSGVSESYPQESSYTSLPTYKFPPTGPVNISSPMSASSTNPGLAFQSYPGFEYQRMPQVASSPVQQYAFVPSPVSVSSSRLMSTSTSKSMSISSPAPPQYSLSASVRMAEPEDTSVIYPPYSGNTQMSEMDGLAPPLAIIPGSQSLSASGSVQEVQYGDYENGKGLELESNYDYNPVNSTPTKLEQSTAQFSTPTRQQNSEAYMSAATFPGANTRHQYFSSQYGEPIVQHSSPNPLSVQCTVPPPAPDSPSTFVPSTSYMPSRAAFTNMLPTLPRSAPSTPMGRQDARFLSATRGYSTPQPFQAPEFPPASEFPSNPQPVPVPPEFSNGSYSDAYLSPALSAAISPTFSQQSSYFSPVDYENFDNTMTLQDAPNLSMSYAPTASTSSQASLAASTSSTYVPYARPPKPTSTKRVSPFAADLELSSAIKKVRKEKNQQKMKLSKMPSPPEFNTSEYSALKSSEAGAGTEKAKISRCRIACNQCRKTRLKCDGKRPCTSCVEKHMKFFPSQTEDEARRTVFENDSCQFEDFVRRRGKGKKTIQKEREEITARILGNDSGKIGQTATFDFSIDNNLNLFMNAPEYNLPQMPQPLHQQTYGLGVIPPNSRSGSSDYSTPHSY